MSRNTVMRIAERLVSIVRDEGLRSALEKIATIPRRTFLHSHDSDAFDVANGTDTWREAPLWSLKIQSDNAKFGVNYQTVDPQMFLEAIDTAHLRPQEFTFVDLGCGKGRILILAARYGFKRVIGVEFSPQLAATARQNLRQVGVSAELLEMDASEMELPGGNVLVYMYNPFRSFVMERVVGNLLDWRRSHTERLLVFYLNPTCEKLFDAHPEFEPVANNRGVRVWRLQ